jgi:hypothetical protein
MICPLFFVAKFRGVVLTECFVNFTRISAGFVNGLTPLLVAWRLLTKVAGQRSFLSKKQEEERIRKPTPIGKVVLNWLKKAR